MPFAVAVAPIKRPFAGHGVEANRATLCLDHSVSEAVQGTRHLTMVTELPRTDDSTRIWSRNWVGTLPLQYRLILNRSNSEIVTH